VTVEIEQVEGDHHDFGRLALQLILQYREIRSPVRGGYDDFAVNDRRPRFNVPSVGRDFSEAIGPIISSTGKNFDGGIPEMGLDAVSRRT
jgi:hypothetical protein